MRPERWIAWCMLAGCGRLSFDDRPSSADAVPDSATSDVVAHWRLDEPVGSTTFADASGKGNVGDCTQCPRVGAPGIRGTAVSFGMAATGIHIQASAELASLSGPLTVSAWVRVAALATYGPILSNDRDCCGNYAGFSLWATHFDEGAAMVTWDGTDSTMARVPGASIPLNTWIHVVGQFDGQVNRVFINGTERVVTANAALVAPFSFDTWIGALGYSPPQYHLSDGTIDELIVFSRALSSVEVMALYQAYL